MQDRVAEPMGSVAYWSRLQQVQQVWATLAAFTKHVLEMHRKRTCVVSCHKTLFLPQNTLLATTRTCVILFDLVVTSVCDHYGTVLDYWLCRDYWLL